VLSKIVLILATCWICSENKGLIPTTPVIPLYPSFSPNTLLDPCLSNASFPLLCLACQDIVPGQQSACLPGLLCECLSKTFFTLTLFHIN
jgi:hypothetical protein